MDRTSTRPVAILLRGIAAAALLAAVATVPARAAEAPAEVVYREPAAPAAPSRIAEERWLPPLVDLPAAVLAAPEALAEIAKHNREQRAAVAPRLRDGFARAVPARVVRLDLGGLEKGARLAGGALVVRREATATWSAGVSVAGAWALRVALSDVALPAGTRVWVYAPDSPALGPFDARLVGPDGVLWLPPMDGPTVYVEIEVPVVPGRPAELRFVLDRVVEMLPPAEVEPEVFTDCDIDGTCVSAATLAAIDDYRAAVARLSFVVGFSSFLCSGGLVNDTDPSGFRPFLLTANHCFDSQASASSLVAYFDYRTATCDGSAPSLGSVPQVSGSTLLASDEDSDFTLVELDAFPSGLRTLLGWTVDPPLHGQTLYRLAHPQGLPQRFSTQSFLATGGFVCAGLPRPDFHYSSGLTGSTSGGSSGSPVVDEDLRIVGQLLGACQIAGADDCNYGTFSNIDGAFATTFGFVAGFLAPPEPGEIFSDGFESGDVSAWSSSVP